MGINFNKGPIPPEYEPIILGTLLTPGYRTSMEIQGFKFEKNADESSAYKGGQIYNKGEEEYMLILEKSETGAPASLYKLKEGKWKKLKGIEIHPVG